MKPNDLKSRLQAELEKAIPPSEIDLQANIRQRLVARKHPLYPQGVKMTSRSNRFRLAAALSVIIVLAALAFITPQGRALAQTVLRFFKPAASESFPIPDAQIPPEEILDAEATAIPPTGVISIAEAEQLIGFDIKEPPEIPAGFDFLGARVMGHTVSLEYEAQGGGGNLIIAQSRAGFVETDSEWSRVPTAAVIPVQIGALEGEFAQGMFVVYGGDTSATWNPDASIWRLRWIDSGTWFEIAKYGDVYPMEYLDQAALIALAESLR